MLQVPSPSLFAYWLNLNLAFIGLEHDKAHLWEIATTESLVYATVLFVADPRQGVFVEDHRCGSCYRWNAMQEPMPDRLYRCSEDLGFFKIFSRTVINLFKAYFVFCRGRKLNAHLDREDPAVLIVGARARSLGWQTSGCVVINKSGVVISSILSVASGNRSSIQGWYWAVQNWWLCVSDSENSGWRPTALMSWWSHGVRSNYCWQ